MRTLQGALCLVSVFSLRRLFGLPLGRLLLFGYGREVDNFVFVLHAHNDNAKGVCLRGENGKAAYLQAKTTVWQTIRAAERTYTAVLADLKESNYNRYFSAVPYIEITYTDGHTQTLYGSYDPQVQSAAAYPLAADALGQMQGYKEAERSVFQLDYDRVGVDLLLPPAAAGEAPQAALYRTPGARYGVWTDWVCQFVEPMHEIFQNDFGYQATITVTPTTGASFSENTTLYLTCEPLTQGYSFDEKGRLIIIKRYALGNYTWAY